jgi:hypothetical protein
MVGVMKGLRVVDFVFVVCLGCILKLLGFNWVLAI